MSHVDLIDDHLVKLDQILIFLKISLKPCGLCVGTEIPNAGNGKRASNFIWQMRTL